MINQEVAFFLRGINKITWEKFLCIVQHLNEIIFKLLSIDEKIDIDVFMNKN